MKSGRILVAALLAAASAAEGQRAGRAARVAPMAGAPVGAGLATMLIEARRELNLTPRQLVALDSIEKAVFAQRRDMMEQMRTRRDSLCRNRQPCELTREERQQLMGGPTAIQSHLGDRLRADSVRRTRILGMLDSTQRRLADRIELRGERAMRLERRVDGPARGFLRDGGPRLRDPRRPDRFRGWDGPPMIDRRFRRDDGPDDGFGPGDDFIRTRPGYDGLGGPPPRSRPRVEEPTPPDTSAGTHQ